MRPGHEHPNTTLNNLVRSVRFTGSIGVVGVYVPVNPGGPDELARRGEVAFDFGLYWFKGQRMGTGQCPVKACNRYLRELIHTGKANPSFVVSHNLPLDRAPEGYQHAVSPGASQIRLSAVRLLLAEAPARQPGATGYAGPHLAGAAQAGSAWARNGP